MGFRHRGLTTGQDPAGPHRLRAGRIADRVDDSGVGRAERGGVHGRVGAQVRLHRLGTDGRRGDVHCQAEVTAAGSPAGVGPLSFAGDSGVEAEGTVEDGCG